MKLFTSKYFKTIFIPLWLCVFCFSISLQNLSANIQETTKKTINGKVTDKTTGEAIVGASISIKDRTLGVFSDIDGNFEIVSDPNAILIVSYIGYETKEIPVNQQQIINIELKTDTQDLEEVIVIGYGTQNKKDVTGSIESVSRDKFNKGFSSNPGQLLQGKVAGINVSNVSGEPGASQNIIIRGIGSLRSGTTPLFVIDGFVLDNSTTGLGSNPLNFINPQDIEKIDVLKDASASAIYGARAANGVIVITTKKGNSGKTEIKLSSSVGFSKLANKIDVFDADEFRSHVTNIDGNLYDAGSSTDWQDVLTRTAQSVKTNLSISGAKNKNFNYYASLGYSDQEGILNNSNLKQYSGKLNLSQYAFDERLKIEVSMTASKTENKRPNSTAIVTDMLQLNPTVPAYTDNKPTLLNDGMLNPITRERLYLDLANNNRIIGNISPSIELVKGLTYKLNFGMDYSITDRDIQMIPYNLIEGYEKGQLKTISAINNNTLTENTLNFKKFFNNHDFNILLGHSYQKTKVEYKELKLSGFANNGIEPRYQDQISSADQPTSLNSFAIENELQSFFGRINYKYFGKYLFTATIRADGSSKFGENNKYGYFPSLAAGWIISKEDFMEDSAFNNLKLRLSWGQTGNQEIPSKITKSSYTDSKDENNTYPLDPSAQTLDDYPFGTIYTRLANPDIQWEVTTQSNVGLDFSLFQYRLKGSIDFYEKVSKNILLEVVPPDPIQPTDTYWTNIPDMKISNSGIEVSLDYSNNYANEFKYNIGGNISFVKNEVKDSPYSVLTTGAATGSGQTGATINGNINGESIGSYYMKRFLGINEIGFNDYEDVNNDGEILENDRIVVGSALPDLLYSFYLNFEYKNIDLGFNFNGVSGNKIFNHTAMTLFGKGRLASSFNTTDFATVYDNESISNSNEVSTRYLENGSYLRLNNATIGYKLDPSSIGLDHWINSLRISITGQNLLLLTDYTGYDPEVNTGSSIGGIQTFGIDRFTYPSSRTIAFNLNITF